jgi:hypothetical protein
MNHSGTDQKLQYGHDVFLIVSNSALVVFALGFIWISSAVYREKGSEVSLRESRFVTTEWNLMQTLKVNTDRQLMGKEQEILALRKRYLQLVQNPESTQGLAELRSQLHRAEEERRDILSLRLEIPATPSTGEEVSQSSPAPSTTDRGTTPSSAASAIFQSRIMVLESQLADEKALTLAISDTLASVSRERDQAARTFRNELALRDAAMARLSVAGKSALETLKADSRTLALQRQALGLDLNTKVLLRAIVSSPEIRGRYPDLLASLDRYFEQFALMENLRGRAEAYAAVNKALEPLQRELNRE